MYHPVASQPAHQTVEPDCQIASQPVSQSASQPAILTASRVIRQIETEESHIQFWTLSCNNLGKPTWNLIMPDTESLHTPTKPLRFVCIDIQNPNYRNPKPNGKGTQLCIDIRDRWAPRTEADAVGMFASRGQALHSLFPGQASPLFRLRFPANPWPRRSNDMKNDKLALSLVAGMLHPTAEQPCKSLSTLTSMI